jgi:predicted peptidase
MRVAGGAVLAAVLTALAGAGRAQETTAGPTRVSPGASTRVWIMAAWDDKCQPLPAPRIDITGKPAKGTITFREGQSTTVKTSRSGTCLGSRVTGTGVYYTANAGSEGPDTFAIEARLATGEVAARTFHMMIAD